MVIQLSGPAGSGKTHSIKNLVRKYPNEVYYINADGKPLTFTG